MWRPSMFVLFLTLMFVVQLLWCSQSAHAQSDAKVIFPGSVEPALVRQSSTTFAGSVVEQTLTLDYVDQPGKDNYIHLDLGVLDLKSLGEGGYVQVIASIDQPILLMSMVLADPQDFWPRRMFLEGEGQMKPGEYTYRYYIDALPPTRLAERTDHVFIMLHGLGGKQDHGPAQVRIRQISLHPQTTDWREQKRAAYAQQYNWLMDTAPIAKLYEEHLQNAVNWDEVANNPASVRLSLDGQWARQTHGLRFWDYAFLADTSAAQPRQDTSDWQQVSVPEPPTPNPQGGYWWYRRTFKLPVQQGQAGKVYLRLDDLADEARIYVNGQLVGSQVGTDKELSWVVENGSRFPNMKGLPARQILSWRNFERCGIPFPIDLYHIPTEQRRLPLPLYSADCAWPLAYDITAALQPGENTLAIRVFGNPIHNWWIFKHRDEDRRAQGIFGLLGSVTLLVQPSAALTEFTRAPANQVDAQGMVEHRFSARLTQSQTAARVVFTCDEQNISSKQADADGVYHAAFRLPASFAEHHARVVVLDSDERVLDERQLSFHGVVVEQRAGQVLVNGEPYIVRGINADQGIAWENDREVTRARFRRNLARLAQLGVNTIRLQRAQAADLADAQQMGLMVMPVIAPASTDYSIGIFGQLVDPDYQLATDPARLVALRLRECPNVLIWNSGNEVHHTPGYDDRLILTRYLEEAQAALHAYDSYRRPVSFANLDSWQVNWFFFAGQGVIGYNTYSPPATLDLCLTQMRQQTEKPFIFTEWGVYGGEKERKADTAKWERTMRQLWDLIAKGSQCAGGFLFPYHGEMDDARGRSFLRELYQPFTLTRSGEQITFRNQEVAPMRELSLRWVDPDSAEVLQPATAAVLAPQEQLTFAAYPTAANAQPALLVIDYQTHRGLRHHYIRYVDAAPQQTASTESMAK